MTEGEAVTFARDSKVLQNDLSEMYDPIGHGCSHQEERWLCWRAVLSVVVGSVDAWWRGSYLP